MGLIRDMSLFIRTSIIGNALVAFCIISILFYNFDLIFTENIQENVDNVWQW